uniref:Uncharacterized protein n=1 Tax=Chenopodium quinoa TaxID=63459 RepID=A0A803N5J5_CHEQI
MVLLKGKTVIRQIKTTENWGTTKNVGMSKFKVYSDRQTVNGRSSDDADAKLPRTSLVSKKKATAPPSTIGTKTKIQVSGAELTRSCHGALDKTKVGRKALADVSNIRRQSSRFEKLSGSRNSVAFGTLTNTSSSSRSQAGNLKGNLTRGVSVSNTAVKVATATTKAQRASSNFHRVKVNETMENITRKISKNSNTITRKSFPVMKKASQLDSSDIKVDKTSEEKSTKKIGFPIKAKVGGKLAPQMSNLSGKVSKEKVNDNFPTNLKETFAASFVLSNPNFTCHFFFLFSGQTRCDIRSLRIQTNKDAFGGVKIPVKESSEDSSDPHEGNAGAARENGGEEGDIVDNSEKESQSGKEREPQHSPHTPAPSQVSLKAQ